VIADTFVVVNPASAGGRTRRQWSDVATRLLSSGVDFETYMTRGPGDATASVRNALRSGFGRVVSMGGDGTLNEVINGFFDVDGTPLGSEVPLGVIPSGTGGDFRKTAGIAKRPLDAVSAIAGGRTRRIDAGRIDYANGSLRHFVNIADCGLGGEVVARVNRSRFKGGGVRGTAVFLWQSLAVLSTFDAQPVRVHVDDDVVEERANSVVVANGQYFGAGMHIAPQASLDDGLFDVVVIAAQGGLAALRGLPRVYRGRHLSEPGVTLRRGARVRVESLGRPLLFDVEGEQVGATPATVTCLPGALTLCVAGDRTAR
jgi:YegS/Rv2252/BmrU family lipid kinase